MRNARARYKDVRVNTEFFDDYFRAPPHVQKAVDKILNILACTGQFTNGMNIHRAAAMENLWIGYITRSRQHWRVLFSIEGSEIVLERLMDHDDADVYFKKMMRR